MPGKSYRLPITITIHVNEHRTLLKYDWKSSIFAQGTKSSHCHVTNHSDTTNRDCSQNFGWTFKKSCFGNIQKLCFQYISKIFFEIQIHCFQWLTPAPSYESGLLYRQYLNFIIPLNNQNCWPPTDKMCASCVQYLQTLDVGLLAALRLHKKKQKYNALDSVFW